MYAYFKRLLTIFFFLFPFSTHLLLKLIGKLRLSDYLTTYNHHFGYQIVFILVYAFDFLVYFTTDAGTHPADRCLLRLNFEQEVGKKHLSSILIRLSLYRLKSVFIAGIFEFSSTVMTMKLYLVIAISEDYQQDKVYSGYC